MVDPNQDAGDDNIDDYLNTPKPGQFVVGSATSTTAAVTLDANGEAEIDFQVGMQPGNNYRVVATLEDVPGNFDQLQVADSTATDTFVTPDDEQITGFTGAGVASPMLTVWRKLHIEQDSMEAVPASGDEKNYIEGTIAAVDVEGSSATIDLGQIFYTQSLGQNNQSLIQNNLFVKGRIEIDGIATFDENGIPIMEITSYSPGVSGPGFTENASITVSPAPGSSIEGLSFKLYDDDERGLMGTYTPLLPRFDLISNDVINKFAPSYITIVDADSLGLNPNKTVPFKRHLVNDNQTASIANDSEDLGSHADDKDFWTLLVTACFQGSVSEDRDPDSEDPPLEGEMLENVYNLSPAFATIFMEGIREHFHTQLNHSNPSNVETAVLAFPGRIADIVAHEIAHGPDGSLTGDDHDEGFLMGAGVQGANFSAESVARFRKAETWR